MRILFISRWYPYPPDNGAKIRIFNLIQQLSKRHQVTLLSFAQEPVSQEHLAKLKSHCQSIHTVQYQGFNPHRLKAWLGFLSPSPRFIVDTYHSDMEALVKKLGANDNLDLVIASQIDMALYALLLNLPRVLEEIELTVARERFAHQRRLVARARYGLTWWKMSRFVARLLPEFDGCTVVSKQEHDLVMSIVPGYDSLAILPNGVDLDTNNGDFGAPQPNTLIYPGALTYSANFDAIKFFLRDVFPRVKAQCPDASLRITGSYNGVPIKELPLGQGAELTGYLDDIRPAVAQSWGCVIPLRVGGGTRLKILEAMALGTPVISTFKGAEGLAVTPGENILIADKPDDFAQAVLRLLGDERLRAKLASNGRRLVEERYSWETCLRPLEQLFYQITKQGQRSDE